MSESSAPSVEPAEAPRRKHLVIVDDEPVILEILGAVFDGSPWRISRCTTGNDALQLMSSQGVDLLLTDKNLPDVNGLELIRRAREVNDLAECVLLTGYASLETAVAAIELDAFDYVLKPLNNVFDIRRKMEKAEQKQAVAEENRRLVRALQRRNDELAGALEETRRLQQDLVQSEKLAGIGTLAAGIAHEIASPLFGIMGLAEAIADEEELATARAHGVEIVEYCKSIRDIVQELTSYSRAASAEYLTTVALAKVVEDAVRLVERSADTRGLRIVTEVPDGLTVNARTSEVQQVFVNLLKNAVEALRALPPEERAGRGTVRVTAGGDERLVWARVTDEGPGIPTELLGVVFDPFYTTKEPGKGTGLGLNIVYRIVTKYRGTVSVESEPGRGASFLVRFPVTG